MAEEEKTLDLALTGEKPLSKEKRAKVLKLFVQGMARTRIARMLKVERAVVQRTIKEAEASGRLPALRDRMSAVLESFLEDVLLEKARRPDRVTAYEYGVYFDRMQLLKGQATQIVDVRGDRTPMAEELKRLRMFAEGKPLAELALPGNAEKEEK